MLCVGIDNRDSARAVALADSHADVYAGIGIHPQMAHMFSRTDVERLEELMGEKVVAIGETGFDLYRSPHSYKEQRAIFEAHIELARRCSLPLIIHDRAGHEQTLSVLDETGAWDLGGVFHCFSGDVDMALLVIERGFFVSIPGVVTYKNAQMLHEVARVVPLERMLVETDAPYLAPQPYRGARNEPSYLVHTVEEIARIKGVPKEEVARGTSDAFITLFKKGDHAG